MADVPQNWSVKDGDDIWGPLTVQELIKSIMEGRLTRNAVISAPTFREGDWVDLAQTPFIQIFDRSADPPHEVSTGTAQSPDRDKATEPSATAKPDGSDTQASLETRIEDRPSYYNPYDAIEHGIVKTINEIRGFGFISIAGKPNLFFQLSQVKKGNIALSEGCKVKCKPITAKGKLYALNVTILEAAAAETIDEFEFERRSGLIDRILAANSSPGGWLSKWSNLRFNGDPSTDLFIKRLASLALHEKWYFPHQQDKFSILKSYLRYTFAKVARETKISFNTEYAVFNTGLVNNLYDPIFAIFKFSKDIRRYAIVDFCCAGTGAGGKRLMMEFSERPLPAKYMTTLDEVMFDADAAITPQWEHVIEDAIERGRFPVSFLLKHLPSDMPPPEADRVDERWLKKYVRHLGDDFQTRRSLKNRIDDAIDLAKKRASWNYKSAIPNYFPTDDAMTLLLPIALMDDSRPDLALVAKKVNAKEYYGVTVLPLHMAYMNARLVLRPDSDWLSTEVGAVGSETTDFEEGN